MRAALLQIVDIIAKPRCGLRLLTCSVAAVVLSATARGATEYLSPPWEVNTFAGYTGSGTADGAAATATFNQPAGIALDGAGNAYIADTLSSTIRKLTPGGTVSTIAGTPGLAGIADGAGVNARFNLPFGLAAASDGTLYIADTSNHIVRRITAAGVVTTLAGSAGVSGSTNASGSAARFNSPTAIAHDATAGVLYVADTGNNQIRRLVVSSGAVTTLTSGLSGPVGLALSADGTTLYVAEQTGQTIQKILTGTGTATILAGAATSAGSADGTGGAARFNEPKGLALDGSGYLYVAEANACRIRRVRLSDALVDTLAGSYASAGSVDGTGTAARFNQPAGIAHDAAGGRLLVADALNSQLRSLNLTTLAVTTLAGPPVSRGSVNGVGSAARFHGPDQMARDNAGNLYVADRGNHTLRKIAPDGTVTTLAGLAGAADTVDGTGGTARLNTPAGVAVKGDGSLIYVSEAGGHVIRKVTAAGVVTTFAGTAYIPGSTDATGTAASFNQPAGLVLDAAGNLYVADFGNVTIRKVTPAGVVTTFAGTAGLVESTNGTGVAARFRAPWGLAIDGSGNLYVADSLDQTIRKITPAAVVSTFAGAGFANGSTDADTPSAARFFYPYGVAADSAGRIYVADYANQLIRRIDTSGKVRTLAGTTVSQGGLDGLASAARFRNPQGIVVVPDGSAVYVADTANNAIRKLQPAPVPEITSPATAGGTVGQAFAGYTITATRSPLLYGASNLPPGLSINTDTGAITGQPLHAGTYVTTLSAQNAGGTGTGTVTFTIAKGAATITLGNLSQPHDGTVKTPAATTSPSGLPVVFTYDGSATAPSAYGSYALVATINHADYAGSAIATFSITAPVDWTVSTLSASGLTSPSAIAQGPDGAFYIADSTRHVIFKRTAGGTVTVFAGGLDSAGYINATGTAARFDSPSGLAFDTAGNLYVADSGNNRIRRINPAGVVSLLAGDGSLNAYDGTGDQAAFYYPVGLAIAPDGALFVADSGNFSLRRIELPSAVVTTFDTSNGMFIQPTGLAIAADGTIFVSDAGANNVWRIDATGAAGSNPLAGSAIGVGGSSDGTGGGARFESPRGLALDAAGNLYVADAFNHTLRKITPAGVVTTIAGSATFFGTADGPGATARFSGLGALVLAADGNLYIADTDNGLLRKAAPPASVPVFNSLPNVVITQGVSLSGYTVSASGSPTTYAATGLPPGLALNASTGSLTGTPTASGIYNVTLSATNSLTTAQSNVNLTVQAPAWADWRASKFSSGQLAEAGVSGPAADPDADGVANLFEYLQDTNPLVRDTAPPELVVADGRLTLTYQRLRAVSGWQIVPEFSDDLFTWHRGPDYVDNLPPTILSARREEVVAMEQMTLITLHKRFMRLVAEPTP